MGGSAKGVVNTVKRAGLAGVTGGLSEFGQTNPFGVNGVPNANGVAHSIAPSLFPNSAVNAPGQTGGNWAVDPAQIAADQASINDLGTQQRADTSAFAGQDAASRTAARQAMSDALTKQAQASFQQALPATEETLNSQHLLNGSGLGQELGRQQGYLATNIANQMGVQGANDLNRTSDINLGGLQGQQALQQGALSRGFSLQDFGRQAQIAQAIGAQAAPQVGNGKGQTGTLLSGIGAAAPPLIGAAKGFGKGGPAGAVAGAALPLAGDILPVG